MSYVEHGFGSISEDQLKKLMEHQRIRISHNKLHGTQVLYLTPKQKAKVIKAIEQGKGIMISLNDKQLKFHKHHGGSILSSILGLFGGLGVKRRKGGAITPIEEKLAYDSMVPSKQRVYDAINERTAKSILGNGRRRKGNDQQGEGVWDDIVSGFEKVGNVVGSVLDNPIVKTGIPLISKLAGMGPKGKVSGRPKKKVGGSFLLQGSR